MRFYDFQPAPSPRRVRMFIAEKGIDIPSVAVDLRNGEHLQPEFLAVNPFATVPVLELDDGTRLTTTAGCRAYIESAHPTPSLLGSNAAECGRIADLIWYIEFNGIMAIAECLRNSAKGMRDRALPGTVNYAQITELAERGRSRAGRFFEVLDDLIGDDPFLNGERLSAADIDAFVFVEFAKWIKAETPANCDRVINWHQRMAERPSAGL